MPRFVNRECSGGQVGRTSCNFRFLIFPSSFYLPLVEVRSVEAIIRALNEAKVQYLIVGGLAVNAHGYIRLTRDVDIVLALNPQNAALGLNTLLQIGYHLGIPAMPEEFADPAIREDWRRDKQMIVLKLWSDERIAAPRWISLFTSLSILLLKLQWLKRWRFARD